MGESFEEYVTARGHVLLRFAFLLSGSRQLAEDLVQEVLARAHQRWHKVAAQVEQPDAYLKAAIARQFISWRRRMASRETLLEALPEQPASRPDTATRHAARDEMWRLLATLPNKQRAVLVLRFYEDLSDERIGDLLGCRPATVRVHAHRGLAKLRDQLQASDPASPVTSSPSELAMGGTQ
jgi:RNA polymerase sigma-70 factor (sigma-E family)